MSIIRWELCKNNGSEWGQFKIFAFATDLYHQPPLRTYVTGLFLWQIIFYSWSFNLLRIRFAYLNRASVASLFIMLIQITGSFLRLFVP